MTFKRLDKRINRYLNLAEFYKHNQYNGKPPSKGFPLGVTPSEFFALKAYNLESYSYIASDNPEALDELQLKIDGLNRLASFFKVCNADFKTNKKINHIRLTPYWENVITENIKAHGKPFPEVYFTNLRRRRKFTSDRIKALKSVDNFRSFIVNTVYVNIEDGQIIVSFPKKPSQETLQALKKTPLRLKYSRFKKAWVRKFTGQGDEFFNNLRALLLNWR